MTRPLFLILPLCVLVAIGALVTYSARSPLLARSKEVAPPADFLGGTVQKLNRTFNEQWASDDLAPAQPAGDLQVLRRLSLALLGTVPSLEEVREFDADRRPDRLEHWTRRYLADTRFHYHFAERLARAYVGTDGGQFAIYRRDRFIDWLVEQLKRNVPYDQMVQHMLAEQGLWTDRPATNFISAAVNGNDIDENKLAGRTVRAFLGQRMDCAQCHNHPFAEWKQSQFEGLAAYFGQTKVSMVGIEDRPIVDGKPQVYEVVDRETTKNRPVQPGVPFHPEWLPNGTDATRRAQLAAWVTNPNNRRFERAIANRVWGILFGKAYREPVDDLENPPEGQSDVLDILGSDFRQHGYDLRRLILVITASQPFRLSSEAPDDWSDQKVHLAEQRFALFPLIRLRPEQIIGSIMQSSTPQTADQNAHWLFRTVRLIQQGNFVKEYGDFGENELDDRGGTIPQRLLLMNGELANNAVNAGVFNSATRVARLAGTDEKAIEVTYLLCLSRRPTAVEKSHFLEKFQAPGHGTRTELIEDMIWVLFNSTEFSWNH